MKQLTELMKQNRFFGNLPDKYLQLIASFGKISDLSEDSFLAREGTEADQFYVVLSGKLAINIFHPTNGDITVQTIGKGELLGWSWLFPPHMWAFNIKTLKPCQVIAFDGNKVRELCDQDHELGYLFMREFAGVMTARLKATRMQLLDIYGN